MGKQLTEYTLYKWRFILGYTLLGITIAALLIIAGIFIPGGLSGAERESVVQSAASTFSLASFQPESVVNLPYHLFQRLFLNLFGTTEFSIKLPSLILGALSAIGMFILLRMWFRRNVAVLTAIIVITTGQFLFVAQSGSPSIVYVFWSVWLLVLAMLISRRIGPTTIWKIALFGVAALSLYTPLSGYILLALVSALLLHPHLRYLVRKLSKAKIAIGFVFGVILIIPLAYAVIKQPSIALTLLGIPNSIPNIQENLLQLLRQYFDFVSPSSGAVMTPVYGLGSVILIVLGLVRLATTKYTARSYIIAAWTVMLAPVLLINPGYISVTFVPVMLLIAMGIHRLLGSWYSIFPRNPYARFAGLIPLSILVAGLVISGVSRYVYGYTYDPHTATNFSYDLDMLHKEVASANDKTAVVVSKDQKPFYDAVATHTPALTVATSVEQATSLGAKKIIVSHDAHYAGEKAEPERIVTDSRAESSDRFYIYKTEAK